MPQKFTNGGRMKLTASIGTTDTTIQVTASLADKLPVVNTTNFSTPIDWCRCTLVDNAGNFEVIKVGTRASGSAVLTNVLRAQEGTTALAFGAGSLLEHCPTAADYAQALAGFFTQFTATNGIDAAAAWHIVGGVMKMGQADPVTGVVSTDRFTFDQTNGRFTCVSFSMSSDERDKADWKKLPRNFVQRLADVKHGIFRRKSTGRREVGVSAQSLREVLPVAVRHDPADGMLSVDYPAAALVACIALAQENGELRAELADLTQRVKKLERRG